MSVLLKNGLVVTSTGSYTADVYIGGRQDQVDRLRPCA